MLSSDHSVGFRTKFMDCWRYCCRAFALLDIYPCNSSFSRFSACRLIINGALQSTCLLLPEWCPRICNFRNSRERASCHTPLHDFQNQCYETSWCFTCDQHGSAAPVFIKYYCWGGGYTIIRCSPERAPIKAYDVRRMQRPAQIHLRPQSRSL